MMISAAKASEYSLKGGTFMYAIIATGGKQYKVSEGDVVRVEKLDCEPGKTVTFDQVLAISGDTLKVAGDVAGATVTGTVMDQGKAKKVIVYKYKPKTGYHKKNGHRQAYTAVKIDKINA
jgi:large subunit ribosomal protein L21